MFFESPNEIADIAGRNGCAIFVVPKDMPVGIKNALILAPDEKTTITIDQVREMLRGLSVKQTSEQYIIIRPADRMGEEAANAFLKNLEEPKEHTHFVLVTDAPSKLLPTILSRSVVYFLRGNSDILVGVNVDVKIKDIAKRLMVAKPVELVTLAEEICKKKEGVRAYAMDILAVAIEMLYKSYFITGKEIFLKKLPGFLLAYKNIEKNGHVKLHLVADLI